MEKSVSVYAYQIFLFFIISSTLLFCTPNQLKQVEIKKGELRLEFTHKCDKSKIKTFTLSHPYRKVFDFKNVRLLNQNIFHISDRYKIAQFKPNIVRVVIQNTKPYNCTPYQPMLTEKEYHIPLPKSFSQLEEIRDKHTNIDIQIEDIRPSKAKYVYKEKKMSPKKYVSHKGELIVIDAGHGGHDSGAVGGRKKEKDLVLSIAKKVAKELKRRGYAVYLTRHSDRFLKLSQRTHIADKKGAAAFISIHANSVPKKRRSKVHGIETFFLQNTRDAKSQRIAARENAAVLKGAGSKLSKTVIIDSVLNGPKIVQSNKLAIDVQKRIITNLRAHYSGVKDSGVRHAPFYVLVGASRPSILVEVGYISHPKERKRLFNAHYQSFIAKGIAEGVSNYLMNRKKEIDF